MNPNIFGTFESIDSATQQLPASVTISSGEVVTEANEVLRVLPFYTQQTLKKQPPSLETLSLDASKLNESFSFEELKAAILSNDSNKSPGYDQIRPLFIRNEACIHFPHIIFNYCFQYGVVPDAWFEIIIKPIPKSITQDPSYRL